MNAAMTLADYTCEQLCLHDVPGRDAPAVLSTLSHALEAVHVAPSALSLFNAALNQYFLARADHLGDAAYCVGSLPSMWRTAFAVARTRTACVWRQGVPPVHVVFLIATRPIEMASCQDVAAALTRLVADPVAFDALQSADTPARMRAALAGVPVRDLLGAEASAPSKGDHPERTHRSLRWW